MTTMRGRRAGSARSAGLVALAVALCGLLAGPGGLKAQDLAEYDYENLAFRGVGVQAGYIFPNNVREAYTYGARLDLGFLGPGLRVVPGFTYWSSRLVRSEVRALEGRLADLVVREAPPNTPRPEVDLEPVEWTDLVLSVDGQLVWTAPLGLLTYAGLGGSAHLMNGSGPAIDDTFVEDLLDSVRAGVNLHGGLEVPVHEDFRFYGDARYEVLGDLRYLEVRLGGQIMLGPAGPEEARNP